LPPAFNYEIMIKSFIVAAALFWTTAANAQPNSAVPKNIRAANTLDNLFDANGLAPFENLYGIPLEPGRLIGNAYLNEDWKRATLLLYGVDKMIEGYPSRYEIDQDQFEIKSSRGVKILSGKKVKSFVWVDSLTKAPHYFINGKDFTSKDDSRSGGFFEVLEEGEFTLLSKTEVIVKKSNYNEKLDIGDRDDRMIKKTRFYYLQDGNISELPSSRKKLVPVFGDHALAMDEFIKKNSLSVNQPAHLRIIFEHYNSKVVTN
jgi:hypothetical protein